MKILIVEDDFISRKLLNVLLKPYGDCDIAVNGKEAVEAFQTAVEEGQKYDLICLDILMPEMDGQEVLKKIRKIELKNEIFGSEYARIIMTTALSDSKSIMEAFSEQCEAYIVKPITKDKLIKQLHILGLAGERQAG